VLTAPSDGMFGDGFRWRFKLLKVCSQLVTSVFGWLRNRFGCPSGYEPDNIGQMSDVVIARCSAACLERRWQTDLEASTGCVDTGV